MVDSGVDSVSARLRRPNRGPVASLGGVDEFRAHPPRLTLRPGHGEYGRRVGNGDEPLVAHQEIDLQRVPRRVAPAAREGDRIARRPRQPARHLSPEDLVAPVAGRHPHPPPPCGPAREDHRAPGAVPLDRDQGLGRTAGLCGGHRQQRRSRLRRPQGHGPGKPRHRAPPLASLLGGRGQTHDGMPGPRRSQLQRFATVPGRLRPAAGRTILGAPAGVNQRHRQHGPKRRGTPPAAAEGRITERQQATPALGNERGDQLQLADLEVVGLDVRQHDRLICEQRLPIRREAVAECRRASGVALHVERLLAEVVHPLADHGVQHEPGIGLPDPLEEGVLVRRRSLYQQHAARARRRGQQHPADVVAEDELAGNGRHLDRVERRRLRIRPHAEDDARRRAGAGRRDVAPVEQPAVPQQPYLERLAAQIVTGDRRRQVDDGLRGGRMAGGQRHHLPIATGLRGADPDREEARTGVGRHARRGPRAGLPAVGDDDHAGHRPSREARRDALEGAGEVGPLRVGLGPLERGLEQAVAEPEQLDVGARGQLRQQAVAHQRDRPRQPRGAGRVRDGHAARMVHQDRDDRSPGRDPARCARAGGGTGRPAAAPAARRSTSSSRRQNDNGTAGRR